MRIFNLQNEFGENILTEKEATKFVTPGATEDLITSEEADDNFVSTPSDYLSKTEDRYLKNDEVDNEYTVTPAAITLSKSISENTIVLNSNDVPTISSWSVYKVEATLQNGEQIEILPEVSSNNESITLIFGDGSKSLEFTDAVIYLNKTIEQSSKTS